MISAAKPNNITGEYTIALQGPAETLAHMSWSDLIALQLLVHDPFCPVGTLLLD
jgi:hypothetical protein